jgi:uncharacterized linocin/CFP29 family protein
MAELQIQSAEEGLAGVAAGSRPLHVNKRTGVVQINTPRGITVNSMLREDEWVSFDAAVIEAARYPLRAVNDLRGKGLVKRLGGIGTLVSSWYVQSEMTGAVINMTGQTSSRDLPDLKQLGAPIPVVTKEFPVDARTLAASRLMGDGLDVTGVTEATRVVAEALENLLVNGASVQLNGSPLYGYTTHPDRNTDTGTNYGGGDWGTVTNVVPTVAGMINAATGDNHYGPYMLYVSPTQYNQATLSYYTDGSGETPAQRVAKIPQIAGMQSLPVLADGACLLIQMDRAVAEWAEALDIQVREWTTGDGMATTFKVLAVAGPLVKSRYNGMSGIIHATGI